MKMAWECASLRGMFFGILASLALCSSGCNTTRTIHVLDSNGAPVPDALVLFRECNISPLWNRTGTRYANNAGDCEFKANNQVLVEAFGRPYNWGELFLSDSAVGTIVLSSAPYRGTVIDWYLSKTPNVPEETRNRLKVFTTDKD